MRRTTATARSRANRTRKNSRAMTGRKPRKNAEAARLWISGLEMVDKRLGINRVMDLSATPFFLRGSGYAEGTLFPWTMSDFSLMDAIECGIVKLPRVPVADNIPGGDMPKFRELWENIRYRYAKEGKGVSPRDLDPLEPCLQFSKPPLRRYTVITRRPSKACKRQQA